MSTDPTVVDPDLYRVILENDRVRVLEYRDKPGDKTRPHHHPDSVLCPLSSFRRRISAGGQQVEVTLAAGEARWVGAQEHSGENIGDTETHALFIELKEPPAGQGTAALGPTTH
ncbi:cytoplasmic protein [Nocardia blacklockiae]|uniref:cytoplasmic protein n=1 Tax=Nocardia blacklockiae TaxID=480036 RepID=UPI001894A290|nr:cytoplasmic protein [Nocardia blacklockiae]MBF6170957.1 cytoplasmic protein [Nocardia blacklockiae]